MKPEHQESPDPTVGPSFITETGAMSCSSGLRTGRVPNDKRIVLDDETKDVSSSYYDPIPTESALGRRQYSLLA